MDRDEIKRYLPHREPMLLVDRSEYVGDEVQSEYTIREDDFFLKGHFPGDPLVPGVILCEIMAQSSFLLFKDGLVDHIALYAGMDNVKFRRMVRPGDTVMVRAKVTVRRETYFVVEASAKVGGTLCCRGTLSFILQKKKNHETA